MSKEKWITFGWRVWNTFKTVVWPVVGSILLLELQSDPDSLDILFTSSLWIKMAYGALVTLVGSSLAGIDKIKRTSDLG